MWTGNAQRTGKHQALKNSDFRAKKRSGKEFSSEEEKKDENSSRWRNNLLKISKKPEAAAWAKKGRKKKAGEYVSFFRAKNVRLDYHSKIQRQRRGPGFL